MTTSHIFKMRLRCLGKQSSLYTARSCILKGFAELNKVKTWSDISSGIAKAGCPV